VAFTVFLQGENQQQQQQGQQQQPKSSKSINTTPQKINQSSPMQCCWDFSERTALHVSISIKKSFISRQ
jgi:hypothetical protein